MELFFMHCACSKEEAENLNMLFNSLQENQCSRSDRYMISSETKEVILENVQNIFNVFSISDLPMKNGIINQIVRKFEHSGTNFCKKISIIMSSNDYSQFTLCMKIYILTKFKIQHIDEFLVIMMKTIDSCFLLERHSRSVNDKKEALNIVIAKISSTILDIEKKILETGQKKMQIYENPLTSKSYSLELDISQLENKIQKLIAEYFN